LGRISAALAYFFASALAAALIAAPHNGEVFELRQPDGSLVPARVFGDEFYQDVEGIDGFTLVRDADGWICYAEVSADGSEYVSTGVRYTGTSRAPASRKGVRISGGSALRKHGKNREALGYEELIAPRPPSSPLSFMPKKLDGESPAPAAAVRKVVGITLLIEFPDQKSNISQAAMDDFCNRAGGVNGTAASGSVHDYFYDVSNGLLEYTNLVTPFVTVDSNKAYYDRGTNYQYVPQLLTSALNKLKASGFDISTATTEAAASGANRGRQVAVALNIFYAGSPTAGWANGIWPHSGTMTGQSASINGIYFASYQLSNLGTGNNPPNIGTFVHENGHMLMKWPDLYSYESPAHSNGVGDWCVMNSNSGSNPQQPNPYLRDLAGWIDITPITDATSGVFEMASNSYMAFKYAQNSKESYYIEARRRTAAAVNSRNAAIPGSGLAIWHIHADGKNTTPEKGFPLIALVQADGLYELENKVNGGNAGDLFRARHNASFNKATAPAAVYHDGVLSNIDISEVSDSGAAMSFRVGGGIGGPLTYYLTVANGAGGGYYEAGTDVEIAAAADNSAGRAFLRWTSADIEIKPDDAYALKASVTTIGAEATVTANYARLFALPGTVEADTFGYAEGISGAYNLNGATGYRVASVVDTSKFAEYAVNIESGGRYKFSYRLLTSSSSAGKFYIRDAVNGAIWDSVTVPTSAKASLKTIEGSEANLKKGRTALRFEAAGGNYGIDWIAAELLEADSGEPPAQTTPRSAAAKQASYGIKALSSGIVSFSMPAAGHVSVKMYDARGRAAATLCDGVRGQGVHNISIPAAARAKGLYIVRMRSGGYSKDLKVHYWK
jgi:M6 family metalloprotease-like protein